MVSAVNLLIVANQSWFESQHLLYCTCHTKWLGMYLISENR